MVSVQWQPQHKCRTGFDIAIDGQRAAVGGDDLAHDEEARPEAITVVILRHVQVTLTEKSKDPLVVFARYARAEISA